MGIAQGVEALPLTPLGEACKRLDLTAVHEILESSAIRTMKEQLLRFVSQYIMFGISPLI